MGKDNVPAPVGSDSGKPGKVMYIGPSILDPILLSHRGVYIGMPDLSKIPQEKRAALEACFVPLGQSAAALRELEGLVKAGTVTEKYKKAQSLMRSVK